VSEKARPRGIHALRVAEKKLAARLAPIERALAVSQALEKLVGGPDAGTGCEVCRHPDRSAIDAALASGTSDRRIASEYDVARRALFVHRRKRHR